LTELPSGDFAVDSFFDITYEIEFTGTPGGPLEGLSGVTLGNGLFSVDFGFLSGVATTPDRADTELGNHPNPFNPQTTITYRLAADAAIKLAIFDVAGRRVAELVDTVQAVGSHSVQWQGLDDRGNAMPSGIYFARLLVAERMEICKLMLVR